MEENTLPCSLLTPAWADIESHEHDAVVPDPAHVPSVTRFLKGWMDMQSIIGIQGPFIQAGCQATIQPWRGIMTRADLLHSAVGTDFQGIPWEAYGTTRALARRARSRLYRCTLGARDVWSHPKEVPSISQTQFFEFDHVNTAHRSTVDHYQLRNLLASTAQHDFYYVQRSSVLHTSLNDGGARTAIDFAHEGHATRAFFGTRVTAINAGCDVLIAGTFGGEYAILNLRSESAVLPGYGQLSNTNNSIVNYVELPRMNRSGRSEALLAWNDSTLRVLDCHTAKVIHSFDADNPVNCSATSPDCRLRLLVGDFDGAVVVDADSHRTLINVEGMTGHAFACAWQGHHISMASEDSNVLVYDVRSPRTPLASLPCEMGCTRLLRFSETGGGPPVLVAAEAADYVNVIDATTFDQKQIIDSFGSIGGISLSEDGQRLVVANSDEMFGGIMTFQRAVHAGGQQANVDF